MQSNTSITLATFPSTETRTPAPRSGTETATAPDWRALDAKITLLAQAIEGVAVQLEALTRTTTTTAAKTKPRPPKVLLSFREAACILGIDRGSTLQDLVRRKQIRVVRGAKGRRCIPRTEVERVGREGLAVCQAK